MHKIDNLDYTGSCNLDDFQKQRELSKKDVEKDAFIRKFLEDIKIQELKCFDRVFLRFCLLNGIKQDINKIEFDHNPARPNYVGYYYRGLIPKSNHERHFLMYRELITKPGEDLPVLNIVFNQSLIDESKEN